MGCQASLISPKPTAISPFFRHVFGVKRQKQVKNRYGKKWSLAGLNLSNSKQQTTEKAKKKVKGKARPRPMPPSGGEVNNGDVGGHQPTARKIEEGDLSEIGRAGGSAGNGDPLEAVRSHPRFDEQRRLIQSNPKNITAVLSQIFQLQPEVAHVLRDKHGADAFIEMMDPLAFAARFGATGSPAPTGRPAEAKVASNASAEESDTEEKETVPTKLAAPNGATCYFCLDEGLDESGKPPVRDCSGRGDSAGFAHLSCMIEYAKQKSNQAAGKDFDKLTEPWYHCPNCKQQFKSQLSLDLTSAFVSFADATYGHPGNSYNDKISAAHFGATGSPAPTGRPAEAKVASNASAEESDTEEKETVPTKLAAPNGATCYFCLDEGLDESGKPPVRDCSGRGDSAGFAHLSCMIEYAKQKSNQAAGKDFDKLTEPWYHCPNCKQQFKSQLSLDLTSAFVSFADATYGHPGNSYNDR